MNKQQYEQLNVLEITDIYSQQFDGKICIADKLGVQFPLYQWNGKYIKLTEDVNEQTLKDNTLFNDNLSDTEAIQLKQFLQSKNKFGFTDLTVLQMLFGFWECSYRGIKK